MRTSLRRAPSHRLAALAAGIAAALALAACGGGGDGDGGTSPNDPAIPSEPVRGLTLVPVKDTVDPGGTLTYRLRNEADRRATYGACPTLERLEDGRYVPARGGPVACIEIAYVTEPGETGAELSVGVPPDARPGEYRVTHEITLGGGSGDPVDAVIVRAPAMVSG